MAELSDRGITIKPTIDEKQVFISAVQLAKLAGVKPTDIHYWGRFGYLTHQTNGSAPYPLDQLPKAQLMALFTKRLEMRAEKAARLADQLMEQYPEHPDIVEAAKVLLKALEVRTAEVATLLVEAKLVEKLDALATEGGVP